jgi:CubicO group peptidase (beta-lactamase class C family)
MCGRNSPANPRRFSQRDAAAVLSHSSGMKRGRRLVRRGRQCLRHAWCRNGASGQHGCCHVPRKWSAGTLSYSNVGYVIAGSMLETRAGAPWEETVDHPRADAAGHGPTRASERQALAAWLTSPWATGVEAAASIRSRRSGR